MSIKIKFGTIVVKGHMYEKDILILPNWEVKPRPKHLSKPLRGKYGHTPFSLEEAKEIAKQLGDIKKLIIGTGFDGMMHVIEEAKMFLEERGIEVVEYKSDEAVEKFQELLKEGEKVALLVHITC
ncbi:MAG: MTH938/NDUFAF3 family protein [Candidatus Njordarchaeia archaeon]